MTLEPNAPALDRAFRWVQAAGDEINDLPEPTCRDADKLGTIVYQLHMAVAALVEIETKRAAEHEAFDAAEDFNPEGRA